MIPKVESTAYLAEISDRLDRAGAPDHTRIWAMIETPTAIFDARAIAAVERVAVLIMGTNDLAKELRATQAPGRAPLLPHLSTAVLAAREAGKVILDGVYNDIQNAGGLRAPNAAREPTWDSTARRSSTPARSSAANDTWAPSEEEIADARKVIAAFAEAEADGRGVVTVDGRMIENLHVDNARRVLATADAIASL